MLSQRYGDPPVATETPVTPVSAPWSSRARLVERTPYASAAFRRRSFTAEAKKVALSHPLINATERQVVTLIALYTDGAEGCRLLFILLPGGLDEMVAGMSRPAERLELPPPEDEPDWERIAKLASSHGNDILD
jgi:hypothetical protein